MLPIRPSAPVSRTFFVSLAPGRGLQRGSAAKAVYVSAGPLRCADGGDSLSNEPERTSIQPEDWPLEETTADENSAGLRNDVGVSGQEPRADELEPGGAGQDGDRGDLGTTTSGERGTDLAPR